MKAYCPLSQDPVLVGGSVSCSFGARLHSAGSYHLPANALASPITSMFQPAVTHHGKGFPVPTPAGPLTLVSRNPGKPPQRSTKKALADTHAFLREDGCQQRLSIHHYAGSSVRHRSIYGHSCPASIRKGPNSRPFHRTVSWQAPGPSLGPWRP